MKPLFLLAMVIGLAILAPRTMGQRGGPRHDADWRRDMETFQFLLRHRDEITRNVTQLPDGVESVTESENSEVVVKLRDHVAAMHRRLKSGRPIHMRDSLFRAVFQQANQIDMQFEVTHRGLKVRETSKDPYVVKLIQAHAEVINQFLAKGHEEVRKDHWLSTQDAQ